MQLFNVGLQNKNTCRHLVLPDFVLSGKEWKTGRQLHAENLKTKNKFRILKTILFAYFAYFLILLYNPLKKTCFLLTQYVKEL